MIKGILKIFVVILLLYSIDVMLDSLYNKPVKDDMLYSFVLQELNFCKGGEFQLNENNITCVQGDINIIFKCENGFCKQTVKTR